MTSRVRDERGAVALTVGAISLALVVLAAFVVDIGVQRVARRDMQSLADVVALDLSRELDGKRTVDQLTALETSLANASRLRNSGTLGDAAGLDVDWGTVDGVGAFTALAAASIPNAVRVVASTSVDFAFGVGGGAGGASRSAIATSQAKACFRIGSFALALDSSNSLLLNSLVGDALNLGVLGYDGLANANVSLLGLATELGAGTTDELLALGDVTLNELFLASAEALSNEGGDTADINLLNALAETVPGLPPIAIADLIALVPGDDSALGADVNLLDLVAGSAFVANGDAFLAVPSLTIGIPGIAEVQARLQVIQAPQLACGPVDSTKARTSQIVLDLDVRLLNTDLGVPGLVSVRAATSLSVRARVGDARGTLKKIVCGDGTLASPEGIDVSIATALTQLSLALDVDVSARVLFVRVPVAEVTALTGTNEPAETNLAEIRVPPLDYATPLESGSGTVGLAGLQASDLDVRLLGIGGGLVGGLTTGIVDGILTPIVNPLITNLDTLLLGPLTELLGLNVAGADVFIGDGNADDPQRPECTTARLVG